MLTDERGMLNEWSRGAERLTGYAREETIGMPLWDVQFGSVPNEHSLRRITRILSRPCRRPCLQVTDHF